MAEMNPEISHSEYGDGMPVVLLHGGWLDRTHMIDALEPVFARRKGYRRLYPDMPGHGVSPAGGTKSYQAALERLVQFVEREVPEGPLCFGGESRGGYFARALAQRFRQRLAGLLLIVPAREPYPAPDTLPRPRVRVAAPEVRETLDDTLYERFDRLATQSADVINRIRRTKLDVIKRTDREHQQIVEKKHLFDPDPDIDAPEIAAPTLILLGRQDSTVGYSRILDDIERYPNASVALLDCASHSLPQERPAIFEALVADWLDRVETAQP